MEHRQERSRWVRRDRRDRGRDGDVNSSPLAGAMRALIMLPPARTQAELFAIGVAAGFYPGFRLDGLFLAVALLVAGMGITLNHLGRSGGAGRAAMAMAFAAGLVMGAAAAGVETASSFPDTGQGAGSMRLASVSGVLMSDAQAYGTAGRSYSVAAKSLVLVGNGVECVVDWPGRTPRLTILSQGSPDLAAGYRLSVRNPGPGAQAGLFFAQPAKVDAEAPPGLERRLRAKVRAACLSAVEKASGRASGMARALLLGAKDGLDAEDARVFRDAGCSHILALSGQHLSILCSIVIAAASRLTGKDRAATLAIAVACVFVWIVGPGPSLLRSLFMVIIGRAAEALDRPQHGGAILSIAFVLGLATDPPAARSLSFTLSYLAMAGLLYLGPRFSYVLSRRLPPFIEAPLSASLAAMTLTAPLSLGVFGTLAPVGIIASALAGPLVVAFMWWTIAAAVVCGLVPAAAAACSPVTVALLDVFGWLMAAAAKVPSITTATVPARIAAGAVVVGAGLCVYARPYADNIRHAGINAARGQRGGSRRPAGLRRRGIPEEVP